MEQYYPVEPGTRMVYVLHLHGRPAAQLTQTVLGVRRSRGALLARVERRIAGSDPEHVAVAVSPGEVRVDNQVVLRGPLEPGRAWAGGTGAEPARLEVTDVAAVADVPAGRYSGCIQVSTRRGETEDAVTWYAPGVGMVRHRFRVPGGWAELALAGRESGGPPD